MSYHVSLDLKLNGGIVFSISFPPFFSFLVLFFFTRLEVFLSFSRCGFAFAWPIALNFYGKRIIMSKCIRV